MKDSDLTISIQLNSADNQPVNVVKVLVNGKEFVPNIVGLNSAETSDGPAASVSAIIAGVVLSEDTREVVVEMPPTPAPDILSSHPNSDANRLEEYGGNDFYKTFFGKLTYKPLGNGTSRVTYQGSDSPFNEKYVGNWVEPSRVHRCSNEYPSTGRNYFPGVLSVVYSRVLSVEDGKNILVDFEYNGGDCLFPKEITNQDGIFFYDNKFALESWANSANRKNSLQANPGQVYATLGIPKIIVKPNSELNFLVIGSGESPAIHWMLSDAFDGDSHGRGLEVPRSFADTFGDNGAFFHLPEEGKVTVDFDWQLLPPTYSQTVVQYGAPLGVFFLDKAYSSKQYGLKRVANFDQFRIRNLMEKELGFVRNGATFSMPSQGYCNGGGIHDGVDISEFCTYRFEGDWVSKNPNNMKARTSGGLLIEWIGYSKEKQGRFLEQESAKASRFDGLRMRFNSNKEVEVDHPDFNWYHLASQEWTGGTSTGSELTHLKILGKTVGLNTNGDFWMVNGEEDLTGRNFSTNKLNLFDKIPASGDLIVMDKSNLNVCGLIGKVSNSEFEIWGWSVQVGDELSCQGKRFQALKAERKSMTWEQLSTNLGLSDSRSRGDRKITYTLITLNAELDLPASEVIFKVEKSELESLLDGKYRENCSAQWDLGNDAPGHLMYTDYNINLRMKDVAIGGLIRSTARSLWVEITEDLQGQVSLIKVQPVKDVLWGAGDRLILFDPASGKKVDLEAAAANVAGEAGVSIKSTNLPGTFPKGSVVTALFSLCKVAEFENVSFIKEDGSASYSNRIDYRPQGLRLRQLIKNDNDCRVKFRGGRVSWFSNLENRFEPEIEISEQTHFVNPKGAVPVLLNPIISDKKGAIFGFQYKETGKEELFIAYRILTRDSEVDLSNSILGADLYISGNGKVLINDVKSKNFIENNKDSGVGFNLVFEEKLDYTTKLEALGQNGKVGIMVNSNFKLGSLTLKLVGWDLKPGLFNVAGFQTKQNSGDPEYSKFVSIER